MKTISKRILTIAFCVVMHLFVSQNANADASNLSDLFEGGELVDGLTTFSNFQLLSSLGTSSFDPGQVTVETTNGPVGLVFQGNGLLDLDAGTDSIIFQLTFDASTTGQSWTNTSVEFGMPNVNGLGLIDVFNSISDTSATELANTNAILDPGFGIDVLSDTQLLNDPASEVTFVSSVSLFADTSSNVSLDSFQLTLSVPEPGSVFVLSSAAIIGLLRRTR